MRYTEIKRALQEAQIIDEVSMSPSSLEKFANSPEAEGMLIGIEWEMCVPNTNSGDDDEEWETDYDQNERASDIADIINFFRNGEFSNMSSREADRYSGQLWDEFSEWESQKIQDDLDEDDLNSRIRIRLEDELDLDEYMDQARENIGKGASEDAVQRGAIELRDEAITDMIRDADSRDYQNAYDYAREEIEEEMRGSYYESDWLSDIGVDDMMAAERYWGFDWPHMTSSGGGGDNDVDTVADDFAEATGYEAKGYSGYHSASRTEQQRDGYFIIEPDASIDAERGDGGLEFISPPMPLKDGLEMIKRVKAWASKYGCYTNKSTGLHMNISVPDMTIENLDYVKLALFLGDEYVLNEFGRAYNSYAKSAMKIVKEKVQQNPENATALLAKMKEHLGAAASKLVHSGITQKYTSINTKDKYVEFRGPGGDYLDEDIPKLINTALRAAQALRIATDDGAYKQEYAKKLYKLVEPQGDWTDPNNSVALFSRYALGQINKAELVNNVRQAQVARKEKKGEEQQYWVLNKDGSGGKQMVFATSSTEAIIKGGKQMGMSREDSISQLKAEPFVDTTKDNTPPASVPISWIDWLADTLPTVTIDTINSVRQRIVNHQQDSNADNLDANARDWIVKQIDNELRSRMDQGVVDGNETRWRVILSATTGGGNYNPVYVDADTPRQAKLKAVEIFRRDQNITVGVEDLDAIAVSAEEGQPEQEWTIINGLGEVVGTVQARSSDEALRIYGNTNNVDTRYYRATSASATPTTSREVFDSLPAEWQDWLQGVPRHTDGNLQRIIDNMAQGVNAHYTSLELGQKDFILNTVRQELQRRGNNATAQAAGSAENTVRASLPDAHYDWLENLATHSDMGLINVLNNVSVSDILTDQQAAYFRVQIRHELRRRGINPDSDAITDTEPVQQQGELNFEPAVPQTTATDFEVVKADGSVVSTIRGADMTYAHRKARELEQDLGLAGGELTVRALATQQNESINQLRRLAGLK